METLILSLSLFIVFLFQLFINLTFHRKLKDFEEKIESETEEEKTIKKEAEIILIKKLMETMENLKIEKIERKESDSVIIKMITGNTFGNIKKNN